MSQFICNNMKCAIPIYSLKIKIPNKKSCYTTYITHAIVDCHPYMFSVYSLLPPPQYTEVEKTPNSAHPQAGPHICHRRPNPTPFLIKHPYTSTTFHTRTITPKGVFRGKGGSGGSNNPPPPKKNNIVQSQKR